MNSTQNPSDTSKWDWAPIRRTGATQLPRNIALRDGNLLITLNKVAHDGTDLNTTAAVLSNTLLWICARKAANMGQYTGGGVISKDPFGYGYFEARMRIMAGKGWHSSFWLMRHDGSGGTGTAPVQT